MLKMLPTELLDLNWWLVDDWLTYCYLSKVIMKKLNLMRIDTNGKKNLNLPWIVVYLRIIEWQFLVYFEFNIVFIFFGDFISAHPLLVV